jgi:hypothetical protein
MHNLGVHGWDALSLYPRRGTGMVLAGKGIGPMATDLTTECRAGLVSFSADRNPHLFSSDSWLAFEAGVRLRWQGRELVSCHKSRGYSLRIVMAGGDQYVVAASGDKLNRWETKHAT